MENTCLEGRTNKSKPSSSDNPTAVEEGRGEAQIDDLLRLVLRAESSQDMLLHFLSSIGICIFLIVFADFIREKKGKIWRLNNWGMRRLAYKIKKATNANYVLMNFEIEAKLINGLKRMLDKDERVIRHLVIKRDKAITEDCPPPLEFHVLRQNLPTEDDEDEDEDDDEDDDEDEEEYDEKEAGEYDDEEYDEEEEEEEYDEEEYDEEEEEEEDDEEEEEYDDDKLGTISYGDGDDIEDGVIFIDDDDDAKDKKDNMHAESGGAKRGARRTMKTEKISW